MHSRDKTSVQKNKWNMANSWSVLSTEPRNNQGSKRLCTDVCKKWNITNSSFALGTEQKATKVPNICWEQEEKHSKIHHLHSCKAVKGSDDQSSRWPVSAGLRIRIISLPQKLNIQNKKLPRMPMDHDVERKIFVQGDCCTAHNHEKYLHDKASWYAEKDCCVRYLPHSTQS